MLQSISFIVKSCVGWKKNKMIQTKEWTKKARPFSNFGGYKDAHQEEYYD
jgi:hypothetical protein